MEQHHHTGRVRSLQAWGTHDNYIIHNYFESYIQQTPCHCASNPNKENLHNGIWIKRQQPQAKY
jgi:hypothetical protein